jgi:hypothetical protein
MAASPGFGCCVALQHLFAPQPSAGFLDAFQERRTAIFLAIFIFLTLVGNRPSIVPWKWNDV